MELLALDHFHAPVLGDYGPPEATNKPIEDEDDGSLALVPYMGFLAILSMLQPLADSVGLCPRGERGPA